MLPIVENVLPPGVDDGLAADLAAWVAATPRFRAFMETYRDKIRKKLRGATDAEARRDVRAELAVARLLLGERSVAIEFEPFGSQQLGPDFAVTLGSTRLNLEVTRMRRAPTETAIAATVLGKLRQFPPSAVNVLLLAVEGDDGAAGTVASAIRTVRARADAKDEALFTERGFAGTHGFWDRFLRLGAIVSWSEPAGAGVWVNGSARIPVPPRALRTIERSLAVR